MSSLEFVERAKNSLAVKYASRTHNALISSTALSLCLTIGVVSMVGTAVAQEYVAPGTSRDLTDGVTVEYTGTGAHSAITVENSATLTGTNATISTNGIFTSAGELAAGIRAKTGSIVNLTGGTVKATGHQFTRGILGYEGASISTDGTTISTEGDKSHAVHVLNNATALIKDGTVTTEGSDSFGFSSQNAGSRLTADNVIIETQGLNGFGAFAFNGGSIELNGGSIITTGEQGKAVVAGENSHIDVEGTSIETSGDRAWGFIADADRSSITGTDVDIITRGLHAYGAYSKATGPNTATIILNGGSITTANVTGKTIQEGDGARGYGLFAEGSGASFEATGTEIVTHGQRSYGAYALNGGSVELNDLSITTNGFMAYGVYASGADSVLSTENVNVTTNGFVGDAAWAYLGGTLNLNGGSFTVNGQRNLNAPGETANGLVALGGIDGDNDGTINANGVTIVTYGDTSVGLQAGAKVGSVNTSGTINFTNSNVTVYGEETYAARVSAGSKLNAIGSSLISTQGTGILLADNASVALTSTTISAAQETLVSNLNSADQTQTIVLGAGTVATQNNGTLLRVNRSDDGADGVVNLKLSAGSTTQGDILDEDDKSTGGTDVWLEEGASWTGLMQGIRNFIGFSEGAVNFDGAANIAGNLEGAGTSYSFSEAGGTIGGDVNLTGGSSTAGGSIDAPVVVSGDVNVDQTSILGGNWDIEGHLANSGTLSPGNSIGRVTVGSLDLLTSSIYEVEVDISGDADLTTVEGLAKLAGDVVVTPIDGVRLGHNYRILTADTIENEFESVGFSNPTAFLNASLTHGSNDVHLFIERNDVAFASVAESANQLAVANALDLPDLSRAATTAIAFSSEEGAREAFDQLSGEVHASLLSGLVQDSQYIRNAASDRIRAAFAAIAAPALPVMAYNGEKSPTLTTADTGDAIALWGAVYGSRGTTEATNNTSKLDRSTAGIIVGVDTLVADTWRIGALAGYSRSSYDADTLLSSAEADNFHLGIYGGTQWGAVGFRTGLAYTWSDIETSRLISVLPDSEALSADYDAGTFQIFGELGYKLDTVSAAFEPFINLAHIRARTDAFTETGGAASFKTARSTTNTTFTTLGLRASTEIATGDSLASLHGMLGWRHAGGDINPTVLNSIDGSDMFAISGAPIARNAAVIEAGINVGLSPTTNLDISYSGQFSSGTQQNGLKSRLSVKF